MTAALLLVIVGGLVAIVIFVAVLVSAQRRRAQGFGWYGHRAGTRGPVPEEFYDATADPNYRGDGLDAATDTTLRGDLALPEPPATESGPASESR